MLLNGLASDHYRLSEHKDPTMSYKAYCATLLTAITAVTKGQESQPTAVRAIEALQRDLSPVHRLESRELLLHAPVSASFEDHMQGFATDAAVLCPKWNSVYKYAQALYKITHAMDVFTL